MNNWNWKEILYCFFMLLCLIAIVLFMIFYVHTLMVYGNKPISECPTWVWWLLHNS